MLLMDETVDAYSHVIPSFSVVIPTLNAESEIGQLLESIQNQTIHPEQILVIDSSSTDNTRQVIADIAISNLMLKEISRTSFNHGTTRGEGVKSVTGEFILFFTQDATPADSKYFEHILAPFCDSSVGMVSGRQLPKQDAREYEKYIRLHNYPVTSYVRDINDVSRLGIKAFFASDVCSAYRRTAYQECGGFTRVNTNEDMLMAAKMLENGYKVAYAAEAKVVHSHNLSFMQEFKRNKAIGYFLAAHKDELLGASEYSQGMRVIQDVLKHLINEGNYLECMRFSIDCIARLFGNRVGKMSAVLRGER